MKKSGQHSAESERAMVERLGGKRILVIGDIMLDQFIWGAVRRISPEAPVPVVEVERESWFPGGAANVARNLAPFTPGVLIMGRTGRDDAGKKVGQLLQESGVGIDLLLRSDTIPTIAKTRIVARQQQVVRVDREVKTALSDRELEEALAGLATVLPELDAVILEDYGKGFVTQALVREVARMCGEKGIVVTADPNPAHPLCWKGVSLVKPNRSEAFLAAGVIDDHTHGPPLQNPLMLEVGRILLKKWEVPAVLVTLGEQGMMLFRQGEEAYHIPTRAREVFDVSGAGDTAIALLTLARAAGFDWVQAADLANHASGIVVGKLGTASITPKELADSFEEEASGA